MLKARSYPWLSFTIAIVLAALTCAFLAPHLVRLPDLSVLPDIFLREHLEAVRPEPLEQLRYVLLISLIPLIYLIALLSGRRLDHPLLRRAEALTGSVLPAALSVLTVWNIGYQELRGDQYFGITALIRSFLYFMFLGWLYLRLEKTARWKTYRNRRGAVLLIAVFFTVLQLLPALYTETSMSPRNQINEQHLPYAWDEFQAVVSGKTLLVDFFPQYARLFPYLLQPFFTVMGCDLSVYGPAMSVITLIGLLGVFHAFRRASGGSTLALVIYFLFLSASGWPAFSPGWRVSVFSFPSMSPVRYFLPWLLAGLWSAHLFRPSWASAGWVAIASAAAVINNIDFGLPAFAGGFAALFFCLPKWRRRTAVLMISTLGVSAAGYLFYTVYRSHHLPELNQLLLFQKAFALYGVAMLPMPAWGLHWVAIGTLIGACVFSITMFLERVKNSPAEVSEEERVRWGLLAYAGVFGAGAFAYYVGRSAQAVLTSMFSAWWLGLGLLLIEYHRNFVKKGRARLGLTAALILAASPVFPMALNFPDLGSEIRRLTTSEPTFHAENMAKATLIRRYASAGENVLIVAPFGHRIAAMADVNNVSPYSASGSLLLKVQVPVMRRAIAENGVKAAFTEALPEEMGDALRAEHFELIERFGMWKVWKRR